MITGDMIIIMYHYCMQYTSLDMHTHNTHIKYIYEYIVSFKDKKFKLMHACIPCMYNIDQYIYVYIYINKKYIYIYIYIYIYKYNYIILYIQI